MKEDAPFSSHMATTRKNVPAIIRLSNSIEINTLNEKKMREGIPASTEKLFFWKCECEAPSLGVMKC